jgi:2-methylcitrate dehydratase
MAARQSAAPAVPSDKPYDTEIQDMASYIHGYKVDSDLAVSSSARLDGASSLTPKFQ